MLHSAQNAVPGAHNEEKTRKNDLFFGIMQKITTFAWFFGEKP